MKYELNLTESAYEDLLDIGLHIASTDGPERAEAVLRRIEEVWASLAESSQRGAYPDELPAMGRRDFRQVYFKPYRILNEVTGRVVTVVLIADGRRDMRVLLQQRLLGERAAVVED